MEERFKAIMKKCEYLQAHHEEMKNQNAYLRRPLGEPMKQKRAVEVPKFEGRLDPDQFLEWLQAVERVFEFKETPEDKKVKLVVLKLKKYASLWWTNLLAKRVRQGKETIRTWDKMKSKLKARFLPPTYLHKNYFEPHHLTQTFTTLDEATILAHKVESQTKAKLKREIPTPTQRTYPFPRDAPPINTKPTPHPTDRSTPKPNFPKPPPNPQERRRCYKCQGFGHTASECPSRRVMTMTECQALEEVEWKEERKEKEVPLMEVEEQCIEETDEGELLVLRRALSDQEAPNHGVQEEEEVVCADEGDVLELKQLLNIQKCTLSSYVETHTALPPREPMKDESFTPNLMGLRPHLNDRHSLNLRTNSFLEGENDVYLLGVHCHSFNPTPWELSSTRVQACQGSCWTLVFEFHDKRHVMDCLLYTSPSPRD